MAELLIKAVDYVPDDPAQEPGAFKRGDLVVVMPDGHPWGTEELNTEKFYIVRFPGRDPAEFERYLEPEYAEPEVVASKMHRMGVAMSAALDAEPEEAAPMLAPPELLRIRAWHATGTPEWLQAALDSGPIEAEWEVLKQYVRRKRDGASVDEVL